MFDHRVRVTFGDQGENGSGLESDQIKAFDLTSDMLELVDPYTLRAPLTPALWRMSRLDSKVRIFVDDSQVLEGFVEEREHATGRDGSLLTIAGRDKGGRLVDESAPLKSFSGRPIDDIARELVAPWFPAVTLSNARNRALVRGRGRRLARTGAEPAVASNREESRPVSPGETVASVLGHFLEREALLGWSSADGREFVIGEPNYDQAPQFFFFAAAPESGRWSEANCTVSYRESVMERYSEIRAVGSSAGDDTNYGPNVTRRSAAATSDAFQYRKRLIVADDDLRSSTAAQARADREMALRDATGQALTIVARGFGQALGGDPEARPALFACDTMTRFENEETGVGGDYLITRVTFHRSKEEGEWSELDLVPRGTALVVR